MTLKRGSSHIIPVPCLTHLTFCWWCHNRLAMTSQWPDNCDANTWQVISNELDIDFMHGDIHGWSCKKKRFCFRSSLITSLAHYPVDAEQFDHEIEDTSLSTTLRIWYLPIGMKYAHGRFHFRHINIAVKYQMVFLQWIWHTGYTCSWCFVICFVSIDTKTASFDSFVYQKIFSVGGCGVGF